MHSLRIPALVALVLLVLFPSCSRGGKVIPAKDLSEIYAEMFLADEWIGASQLRTKADTMQVYEPIFEKHGYTVEDYRRSVDRYTRDPGEFAKVFEGARSILDARLTELTASQRRLQKLDSLRRVAEMKNIKIPRMMDEVFSGNYATDTISWSYDSTERMWALHPVIFPVDSLLIKDFKP